MTMYRVILMVNGKEVNSAECYSYEVADAIADTFLISLEEETRRMNPCWIEIWPINDPS